MNRANQREILFEHGNEKRPSMNPIVEFVVYTSLAGAAIPIGGFLASIERIHPEWLEAEFRHTVIAFGGGALISAVALVLIPDSIETIATWETITAFAAGSVTFWGLQTALDRSESSMSQLIAMLSDFIPEVIALGATIATGEGGVMLLAGLIALQNVPEGFNSFRELNEGGMGKSTVLGRFVGTALLGPVLGAVGFWVLSDFGCCRIPQERWGGCKCSPHRVSCIWCLKTSRRKPNLSTPVSPHSGPSPGF